MKTKLQIKSIFGKVLFELEKEDNTIKATVEGYLRQARGGVIHGVDLSNMDLRGIRFNNSIFYNSIFDNSIFYNSSFDNSSFDNSIFYNSSFDNSSFYNSSFYNSSFYNSSFYNSSFNNSSFYNSSFDNNSFNNSSFNNSSFDNSSFDKNCKGIELIIAKSRILPEGDIIGWKKCENNVIVKLLIPSKAKRSNAFGRKCRAEYVKTLDVIGAKIGIGGYDHKTKYVKGRITRCDKWDENFQNECSGGIHFFITRLEAENY